MKRILQTVSALCLAAAALAVGPVHNSQAQEFKMKASLFPPPGNPLTKGMIEWAALVRKMSGGRLDIQIFPASQMGPPPRQFDLVRTGVADFGMVLHGLTPGRFPLMELTHLPGIIKENYGSALALSSIGQDVFGPDHPGVRVLNILPLRSIIISRGELKTVADMKGKRLRAGGSVQSAVMELLGAVPTLIQPGDLNDALGKGMVEGISAAYSAVASYKLDDAGKFIAESDMGGVTFATIMNNASYNRLPADLRKIIDDTSGIAGARLFARVLADDEDAIRGRLIKSGVKISQFADGGALDKAREALLANALKRAKDKKLDAEGALAKIRAAMAKYGLEK